MDAHTDTPNQRWIVHLDMDAFFASVEQLDRPELRGKPVIIGGEERGVVSTCSYEARKFGIRSAMPMFKAKSLCPHGLFLRGRMERYAEKSHEVMEVLERFSPKIQKASIDEAYLDATGLGNIFGTAAAMAVALQKAVLDETGLTCSVGLAPVKFLAKIASDMRKPAGLTIISHAEVCDFLHALPVGKIPGVGPHMQKQLSMLGIRFCADVQRYAREFWIGRLGKAGEHLFERAWGIDSREVEPYGPPKSESAENTFAKDTLDYEVLSAWLLSQAERVGARLRRQGLRGRTITLKYKYADFSQHSRSRTLKESTNVTRIIYDTAVDLLRQDRLEKPLRLIGVGVSQFGRIERQLGLLPSPADAVLQKEIALDAVLDEVRDKFGKDAVIRGKLFSRKK